MKILLELKGELANVKANVAATRAAVESLAGPQGRVTALEDTQKFQRWYTYAVVPALAGLHELARYFGLHI